MLNKIDLGNLQKQRIFLEIRKSSTLKTFVPSLSNSSVQTHNMTCKQERNIWSWGSLCLYKVSPLLDVKPPYDPACPSVCHDFVKFWGSFTSMLLSGFFFILSKIHMVQYWKLNLTSLWALILISVCWLVSQLICLSVRTTECHSFLSCTSMLLSEHLFLFCRRYGRVQGPIVGKWLHGGMIKFFENKDNSKSLDLLGDPHIKVVTYRK